MINVVGNIFGTSGYALHTRNLVNALSKHTKVKLSTALNPGQEKLLLDKEIELIKQKGDFEINLIITNPLQWRFHFGKRNWVYLIWEGDKIPQSFLEECLNEEIEYILVASKHTKQAIKNTTKNKKILSKIKVIHHGVNLDFFYPKKVKKERFSFLCNKGFRNLEDRGGIQYAIKAYLNEFNSKDNVELLIKINPAYGIPNIDNLMKSLTPKKDLPKLNFAIEELPYNRMVDLYNRCDVFVSPSRAEAFNIPCIEAMACGKPVITTNFGGQTDFCNESNGWIIPGKLTEVKHEIQYEGIKWLTPNLKKIQKAMRNAYSMNLKDKQSKAIQTAKQFTWDNSAKKIIELL